MKRFLPTAPFEQESENPTFPTPDPARQQLAVLENGTLTQRQTFANDAVIEVGASVDQHFSPFRALVYSESLEHRTKVELTSQEGETNQEGMVKIRIPLATLSKGIHRLSADIELLNPDAPKVILAEKMIQIH